MAEQEEKKNEIDAASGAWLKLVDNPAKYFPKPVYWIDSKGKEYILVCADYDDPTIKIKIHSYCINDSKWNEVAQYPQDSKPYRFTAAIDSKQDELYIYGGSYACFLKYDLNNSSFKIICKNGQYQEQEIANKYNIKQTGWYPSSVFIDKNNINTFNVISGLANSHHLIWNETAKQMQNIHDFKVKSLFGHSALWISSASKLLILGGIKGWGGYNNDILCCNITHCKDKTTYLWKQYDIQLPLALCYFGCICYNDTMLILFGGEKEGSTEIDDIWCLDITNKENGWIKSSQKCPVTGRFYAVQTQNGQIHLFQIGDNRHWMINIDKIINNNNNNDDIEYLRKRVKEIEDLYLRLNEDHKILQIEYERQGKELKKFREKYGFDEEHYMIWNSDQIVDWIINLQHPRYCKYEFILRKNLKKENVDGEVLGALNRTDWTRYGINDIKDKIDLEKHLSRLIPNYNNNNDNNVEVEQDEGQQTML